jgi:hypothetical protein
MIRNGIYEFIFGAKDGSQDHWLEFWAMLGFVPAEEGRLDAVRAGELYGHQSGLQSIRLRHAGCARFETGLVRLQFWSELRNPGLAAARPIVTGSRWMGLYTHDILQLRDSFTSNQAQRDWGLWLSPLVHAPLAHPPPEHDYYQPFVGLRETLVFGEHFRLAFIQRAGFDRPGFGTFDDTLPYKNTEGSHANIVQPANGFASDFYKSVLGFETAPFGEAHDSGDEPPTIAALDLHPGETFHVERIRAPDCPSGLLQVYSSYRPGEDLRDLSRAGSGNLCLYSLQVDSVEELQRRCSDLSAGTACALAEDEFARPAACFDAPDGYQWLACQHVD